MLMSVSALTLTFTSALLAPLMTATMSKSLHQQDTIWISTAPGYSDNSFNDRMRSDECLKSSLTALRYLKEPLTSGTEFSLEWVLSDQWSSAPDMFSTVCTNGTESAYETGHIVNASDVIMCAESFMTTALNQDASDLITPPSISLDGTIVVYLKSNLDVRIRGTTESVNGTTRYAMQKCFTGPERGGIIFGITVSVFAGLYFLGSVAGRGCS